MSSRLKCKLLDRNVFNEGPISAWIHFYIADPLVRDDHVCRVPEREERQVIANDPPCLYVELFRLCPIDLVDGFLKQFINLGIAIPTAIAARNIRPGNSAAREQIFKKDRILVTADPYAGVHLKLSLG